MSGARPHRSLLLLRCHLRTEQVALTKTRKRFLIPDKRCRIIGFLCCLQLGRGRRQPYADCFPHRFLQLSISPKSVHTSCRHGDRPVLAQTYLGVGIVLHQAGWAPSPQVLQRKLAGSQDLELSLGLSPLDLGLWALFGDAPHFGVVQGGDDGRTKEAR